MTKNIVNNNLKKFISIYFHLCNFTFTVYI